MSQEKRRFPRVSVDHLGDSKVIQGTEVLRVGEHAGNFSVIDISYNSLALRGVSQSIPTDGPVELMLDILSEKFDLKGQVVRQTEDFIAFTIDEMVAAPRLALEKFLKDKIVGLATYQISPKFYSKNEDFDLWFHGPKDTNLYLWQKGELSQMVMELDPFLLVYRDGEFQLIDRDPRSNWDSNYYLENIDDLVTRAPDEETLRRALGFVSQIESDQLQNLMNVLRSALEK